VRRLSRRSWLIIIAAAAAIAFLFLIWPAWGYHLDWTGFGASRSPVKNPKAPFDYYPSKTLWDWMQLLGVPVVLAVAALWFNATENRRDQRIADQNRATDQSIADQNRATDQSIADQNRATDQSIADQNRATDQSIAEDRQQEAALETYFATMRTLVLDKKLRESDEADTSGVRAVARAQTLTTLRRLNGERRGTVVRFLHESHLITRDKLIMDLRGADLRGTNLHEASLYKISLLQADLRGANLRGANMAEAFLIKADLREALLTMSILPEADLRGAILCGANMRLAFLRGANLPGADLSGADLAGIDLSGADLRLADLRGAKGISVKQLEQQAKSLEGAMMPDGLQHA